MQIMDCVKIGDATLYHGDCLNVIPEIEAVDWAVTSPPYNLNKAHSVGGPSRQSKAMEDKYNQWYDDDMPEDVYQDWQGAVVRAMLEKVQHSIFYNHRVRYAWHGRNADHQTPSKIYHPLDWLRDFPIWCEIVWDRCGTSTPTGRFGQSHELIYQIGKPKGDRIKKSYGMTDVWRIPPSPNEGHVCTFPKQLVSNCLLVTQAGDSVMDPFMGSGTTGVVCLEQGRKFVGIERDKAYFDLAVENIQRAYDQPRLFVNDDPAKQECLI